MTPSKIVGRHSAERRQRQLFTVVGVLLSLLIVISIHPVMAQDQNDEPLWQQNLTCNLVHQQYQGVEYCTGLNGLAYVLVIDLHDESGIRFEYVIAEGLDWNSNFSECRDVNIPRWSTGPGCADPTNAMYYPVMSLLEAVGRYASATAVINTDYGAGTQDEPDSRGHGPEGLTIIRGERLDGPLPNGPNDTDGNAVQRPWLAISGTAPYQVLFDQLDSDSGSELEAWMYLAFGGAPWLIRDGQKDNNQIINCTNAEPWSCQNPEAQTAVAISEDRRWLYLIIANGVDAGGITDFMLETLQPWEAIKLDGGGSSQMWYGGLPEDQRVVDRGDGRQLSQYLAIIAPPGDGINLQPPPPVQPPDLEGWWERLNQRMQQWWAETWPPLQDRISNWWERTWDDIQQRVDEWWKEQQDALVRWIEGELAHALGQLCGAAALPPGVLVAIVWAQRRNRKRLQ